MGELKSQSKYTEIIVVAKKMLSIDYTDMEAHKILSRLAGFWETMPIGKNTMPLNSGS